MQQSSAAKGKATEAQLSDINSRLGKRCETIEPGSLDFADFAPGIKVCGPQEIELVSSRVKALADWDVCTKRLVDRQTILACMRDLKALASAGTPSQRKAFLNGFIRGLTITGNELKIERCPRRLSRLLKSSQKFCLQPNLVEPASRCNRDNPHRPQMFGGACGDRTRYLLLAKQALSQMS